MFNPGPLPLNISLSVDEMLGLSNASRSWSWLVTELYPLAPASVHGGGGFHPIALWSHGQRMSLAVGGTQVRFTFIRVAHVRKRPVSNPLRLSLTTAIPKELILPVLYLVAKSDNQTCALLLELPIGADAHEPNLLRTSFLPLRSTSATFMSNRSSSIPLVASSKCGLSDSCPSRARANSERATRTLLKRTL